MPFTEKSKRNRSFNLGQYQIQKLIGDGTYGRVFLGKHTTTHQKVALKIQSVKDPLRARYVTREIEALKRLNHEHIVKLLDVVEQPLQQQICIVLEYVEGSELFKVVTSKDRLTEDEAKPIIQDVLRALHHCHQHNVVHRDIKPENIIVTQDGRAKLIDFGLSSFLDTDTYQTRCGSLHYAAPEVVLGQTKLIGTATDIWSFGVLLYVVATGLFPWEGEKETLMMNIIKANYEKPIGVSKELDSLLQEILVVDPDSRPSVDKILQHPWFTTECTVELSNDSASLVSDSRSIVSDCNEESVEGVFEEEAPIEQRKCPSPVVKRRRSRNLETLFKNFWTKKKTETTTDL